MSDAMREAELGEYLEATLPEYHGARRRHRVLEHCREHPFRWAVLDFCRKYLPFRQWRSPMGD